MSNTGFTTERESPHRKAVAQVIAELSRRGWGEAAELAVDGHRPDLEYPWGYVEVKTSEDSNQNLAIELNSLNTYRCIELNEGRRVYIIHVTKHQWCVHTPDSFTAGIYGGPRRTSGNGSLDDWYLCTKHGTPFDKFFPAKDKTI